MTSNDSREGKPSQRDEERLETIVESVSESFAQNSFQSTEEVRSALDEKDIAVIETVAAGGSR